MDPQANNLTALTVDLLSAYVSNNSVASEQLATLIQQTYAALVATESAPDPVEPEKVEHVPAVTVRKSLASREHILSMIDGKPYKTLRRHIATHGMTDKDYRARYKLPTNYPMVAPAYAEHRRNVALSLGLGRKPKAAMGEAALAPSIIAEPGAAMTSPATGSKAKIIAKAAANSRKAAAKPANAAKLPTTKESSTRKAPAAKAAPTTQSAPAVVTTAAAPANKSTDKAVATKKSATKVTGVAKTDAPKVAAKPAAKPASTKATAKAAAPAKAVAAKTATATKTVRKSAPTKKPVAAKIAPTVSPKSAAPTE